MTFTGTNLDKYQAANWKAYAHVRYEYDHAGVLHTATSDWTATKIVADFRSAGTGGYPHVRESDTNFYIEFVNSVSGIKHRTYAESTVYLPERSVTISIDDLDKTSLMGGQIHTITGAGLYATMHDPNARLQICGFEASLDEDGTLDHASVDVFLPKYNNKSLRDQDS